MTKRGEEYTRIACTPAAESMRMGRAVGAARITVVGCAAFLEAIRVDFWRGGGIVRLAHGTEHMDDASMEGGTAQRTHFGGLIEHGD